MRGKNDETKKKEKKETFIIVLWVNGHLVHYMCTIHVLRSPFATIVCVCVSRWHMRYNIHCQCVYNFGHEYIRVHKY